MFAITIRSDIYSVGSIARAVLQCMDNPTEADRDRVLDAAWGTLEELEACIKDMGIPVVIEREDEPEWMRRRRGEGMPAKDYSNQS